MKTGINSLKGAACLAVATMIVACQKAPVAEPVAEQPEVHATPAPLPSAPPAAPAVVATAPVVADPLAPPGTFFLLQQISVTTDSGIVGIKPGQLVREVKPGVFEANGVRIQVRPSQLTNNLRIARELASADANIQAALRAANSERTATTARGSSGSVTTTLPVNATTATTTSNPAPRPVASAGNSLNNGPRLGGGTGFADPEFGNRKNAKVDSSGRMYWRDSTGRTRYDF